MTKQILRSHAWHYHILPHGDYSIFIQQGAEDETTLSVTLKKKPIKQTHPSWEAAETAIPKFLMENNLPWLPTARPDRVHDYQLDGDVRQRLNDHIDSTTHVKSVAWSLKTPDYFRLEGLSPTWDDAIADSLAVLPDFRALIKAAKERSK